MSEHDDIEKKLGDYREARDRELPSDRRLLPVHKDRLLAEARRLHGAKKSAGWIGFFRPAVRWAVVTAPIVILALAGYFWFQDAPRKRSAVSGEEDMSLALSKTDKVAGERKRMRVAKEEFDAEGLAATPAEASTESRRNEGAIGGSLALEQAAAPASPPVASTVAPAEEPIQTALLDVSGQYRSRIESNKAYMYESDDRDAPAAGKDLESAKTQPALDGALREDAGAKQAADFTNFKLVQSADTLTLVDDSGSTYVGRIAMPQQVGNFMGVPAKAKVRQKQEISNLVQQVNLTGTNRTTREVVTLVASFYAEPALVDEKVAVPEPKPAAAAPQKKAEFADKLQQAPASNVQYRAQLRQSQIRMRVRIERLDLKNNRQERLAEAERLDAPAGPSPAVGTSGP